MTKSIRNDMISGALSLARQLEGALLLLSAANDRLRVAPEPAAPVPSAEQSGPPDLLIGAKAISKESGFTQRHIYNLLNKGSVPIWREPGLGIVASRSGLAAYIRQRAELAIARTPKAA